MKKRMQFEQNDLHRLEDCYQNDLQGCGNSPEELAIALDCIIDGTRKKIYELTNDAEELKIELMRMAIKANQPIELRRHCASPVDYQEEIDFLHRYIEYLSQKRNEMPKGTKILKDNEKFEMLNILGFFDTDGWNSISNRSDQNKILSELLVINEDTAKGLINSLRKRGNPKYRLKLEEREKLKNEIKAIQNGALK